MWGAGGAVSLLAPVRAGWVFADTDLALHPAWGGMCCHQLLVECCAQRPDVCD